MPLILPYGVSIGLVNAAVAKAPTGQPIRLRVENNVSRHRNFFIHKTDDVNEKCA